MADYTLYDPATGRIVQVGTCTNADLDLQGRPGCVRLDQAAWPDHDYVDLSGPAPRVRFRPSLDLPEKMEMAQGQSFPMALPWPGTLTLDGVPVQIPSGTHSLSAEWPGTYELLVEAWPAQTHRMIVEVLP